MAEIVPVVSEALEAQVRNLLPSQRGFGEDLQASNVIFPIIDLTPAAEGTTVPEYQQQAQAFGSQTGYQIFNATTTLANSPGFWRFQGSGFINAGGVISVDVTDGLSSKQFYRYAVTAGAAAQMITDDFIVFLAAGESVSATVNNLGTYSGSYRQIADVNGNPVNPVGFTPQ